MFDCCVALILGFWLRLGFGGWWLIWDGPLQCRCGCCVVCLFVWFGFDSLVLGDGGVFAVSLL